MHRYIDPADGARTSPRTAASTSPSGSSPASTSPTSRRPITLSVAAPTADWTVLGNGRPADDRTADVAGVRDHAADPDVPVRGLRGALALGDLGARRACRSAGTRAARWPPSWSATRRAPRGSPRPASTTTRDLFDEPYPFDSYDQVFAPGLNWGAMETPGCVTFRDELLAPDGGSPTPTTSCARW